MTFEHRVARDVKEAEELSGLWTNTAIADKIDSDVAALLKGIKNGEAEEVTDTLLPDLEATLIYADEELLRQEG